MKKKQLFAVLLAGSMTVGMAPAAAFAAEETTQTEAQVTDENTENTDTAEADAAAAAEAQKQTEEQAAADAAAKAQEEAAAQAQADADAQVAAAQAQAAAEAQAVAEAEAKAQEQADEEAEAKAAEVKANGTVVTDEKGLNAAIEAAETVDTTNTAITEVDPTKIVIKGTIELTGSVTIPANKSIVILGADDQAAIHRADGFKGTLFEVSAGSAFYMAKKDATDSEPAGTLEVNGSVTDGTAAVEGSLVHVAAGANFSMTTGITLCNNNTTAKGAAIFNEGGNVLITGGTITGNKSDNGAVYSTGTISVKKGEGATDIEPSITDNFKTDGKTPANVILSGEGKIEIKGALTDAKIGFSVEKPKADLAVIVKADDVAADVYTTALGVLAPQYEGDAAKFTVDAKTGKLVATAPVEKPVVTIKKTEWKSGPTGTAVINSDKAGKLYYACVAKGAAAPNIDTSAAGTDVNAGDNTITVNNLSGKEMDLYVCVKTADGAVSETVKTTITLVETLKTAPKVTASFSKWKSISEAVVTIKSDKKGQYYYKLVKHGTKVTSIDTSKAGKDIAANTSKAITLSKLDTKTSYDVYVCVKDSDGLVSDLKKVELSQSKRPTPTPAETQTKASLSWKGSTWRNHSSATVTCIIGADGICNYTWKVKDSKDVGGSGKVTIKADKAFNIELNNLPEGDIEIYISAEDSKGNAILLQPTINGTVKTAKSFKIPLAKENRPNDQTPTPTNTPGAYVPKVEESIVQGLKNPLQFYPNTFYEFTPIGAGTTNNDPGEGDVKWVPLYWSTSSNPSDAQKHSTWKIGSTKGISKEATYNMYIFFQKWVYTGGQWIETDTVESAMYQFRSAALTPSGTGTPDANGVDGQTGTDPNATVTGEASATSSRNAVSTADNSPIGTMSALAAASILAGGYVLIRRRKKDI